MLIDSGSEMCVMSKKLWKTLEEDIPIDTDIQWSIGSANATQDRVFGVCHSVAVDIVGVEIRLLIFVLDVAAQDLILGRPWERKARAQYDNRDNGSLYISISAPDNQRKVVFCAVGRTNERNRDKESILQHLAARTTIDPTTHVTLAENQQEPGQSGNKLGLQRNRGSASRWLQKAPRRWFSLLSYYC